MNQTSNIVNNGFSTGMIMDSVNNQNISTSEVDKKRINDAMMDNAISNIDPTKSINIPRKQRQVIRVDNKVNRNDLCPCGSGKKFKKCCMGNGKFDVKYKEK